MKKILLTLILAISIISLSIGHKTIDLEGGAIREDNVIWSKAPYMVLKVNNYSIVPKKMEIAILNIHKGSTIKFKDHSRLINPEEKIILDLPPLSQNIYFIKSSKTDNLRFAIVGDSRQDSFEDDYPKVFRNIMENIDSKDLSFVIHLGDFVIHEENKYFDEFEEIIRKYDTPVYTVIGNHDGDVMGGSLYERYYGDRFYSFAYMGTKFIILDNSIGLLNQENLSFLENELKFDGKKLVFLHMPAFDPRPSGIHSMLGGKEFMQIAEDNNVDIVFSGHVHIYHQVTQKSTKYIITGGGGSPIYASERIGGFYHYLIYDQGNIQLIKMEN
ncbi:MAG: cyclic 3',5'-adenosine monophosphate phosphodiesterase [Candidatus Methanofastidiosum methylothiophilum]|uniref:Cyclic 3',5'-adenosine monophosphate phosphodiesterase n=1 Tax=Candidatus Methanofastidiosum methylothiophilum TaxID=1705564 RepID=A0A150IK57_9EURY|nr:MAG: cyclic 3',5'-adenosine monophosphate phosphodiesterase [Candidatus Methanofastidiosum methylthiophilus]KYC47292.1 MAG: cyclic 3',5'-adenosine monophosphate phosphodiesterase [Candidatus Methanofastidiosum methylthiophilus]KYC49751.1 MAG: cyclic 3',5'-adenosine monophosphate phosphodiesterase [Candidatus Methanofastidiosum methylthiophilus]